MKCKFLGRNKKSESAHIIILYKCIVGAFERLNDNIKACMQNSEIRCVRAIRGVKIHTITLCMRVPFAYACVRLDVCYNHVWMRSSTFCVCVSLCVRESMWLV